MKHLKALIYLTLSFCLLCSACSDQDTSFIQDKGYFLEPEHIPASQLQQELINSSTYNKLQHDIQIQLVKDLPRHQKSPEGLEPHKLLISGNQSSLKQLIRLAQHLDIPQSYLLDVSNISPGSISTSGQQMQIILHPEEKISLSNISLKQNPWQSYLSIESEGIELYLTKALLLKIKIQQGSRFIEVNQPLKLNNWLQVFSLTEGGGIGKLQTPKRKKIALRDKQLWLRLSKSQP